jgi:hypothetical protein
VGDATVGARKEPRKTLPAIPPFSAPICGRAWRTPRLPAARPARALARPARRRLSSNRYDVYLAIDIVAPARLPDAMARMDNAAAARDRTAASNGAMIVGWPATSRANLPLIKGAIS